MSKSSHGYTLVELMIAIAIGAVIMFGVTTTFVGSMQTSAAAIRGAQFHEEMRSTMGVITHDVRRSGYSSKAQDDVGKHTFTNKFLSTSGEDVRLWQNLTTPVAYTYTTTPVPPAASATGISVPGNCVTFSYDAATPEDGDLTTGSSDFRGFKFVNGIVYKRVQAGGTDRNCLAGTWYKLTTDAVVVDGLTFQWVDYTNKSDPTYNALTPSPAGCASTPLAGDDTLMFQRTILVTLTAHSVKDTSLRETLVDNVKVRNMAYNPCGV